MAHTRTVLVGSSTWSAAPHLCYTHVISAVMSPISVYYHHTAAAAAALAAPSLMYFDSTSHSKHHGGGASKLCVLSQKLSTHPIAVTGAAADWLSTGQQCQSSVVVTVWYYCTSSLTRTKWQSNTEQLLQC
eukprot:3179-Heterococcus_DN1.PRE.4